MSEDQKDITPRAEVLREAEQLITGDRNETYGTPTQNFKNIADLWNVQFKHLLKDDAKFDAKDVALAQIHVKMARSIAQPKRDNWVDLAGYAACGYETTLEEKPEAVTGVVQPVVRGTWTPFVGLDSGAGGITINNETPAQAARRVQQEVDFGTRYDQTGRSRG